MAAPQPLLVVILGPHGQRKDGAVFIFIFVIAIALAQERFSGEIVNCDSVAMYREFDLGTAKPSAEERSRAPHHLFDCVAPTAHDRRRICPPGAASAGGNQSARSRLPIVVGGTGFYLRALLDGLFPVRSARKNCASACAKVPPVAVPIICTGFCGAWTAAAEKIHANDVPKLIRAIEVCLASRQRMSELWRRGSDPLQGFRILRWASIPTGARCMTASIGGRSEMFEAG
jgi:tRNA dimethylallyltransferase